MPDILKYAKKEDIPEGLREHATELSGGGGFEVAVVAKKVHDGFRDNNTNLLKERDALKTERDSLSQLIGADPTVFKTELEELRGTAQKVKDGTLKGNDAIESEVQRRVAVEKTKFAEKETGFTTQLQAANAKGTAADQKYRKLRLAGEVSNFVLAGDSGFNPSALPDIQSRAEAVWRVQDDGSTKAYNGDEVVYSTKEPGTPLTMKEWLGDVLVKAPHFSKASKGAGGPAGEADKGLPTGVTREQFDKMDPSKRIQLHRATLAKARG